MKHFLRASTHGRLNCSLPIILTMLLISGLRAGESAFDWALTNGTPAPDSVRDIAIDSDGNVIVCGGFLGSLDFDPGPGEDIRTDQGGYGDIFVTKFTGSGDYLWTVTIGQSNLEIAMALVVDDVNNIYFTGSFSGYTDFDPGDGVDYKLAMGAMDVFITKLSEDGTYQWTKSFGASFYSVYSCFGQSIAMDPQGRVVSGGVFSGTVDFDPSESQDIHVSAGGFDIYVMSLDQNGEFCWVRTVGGTEGENSAALMVDEAGNVYYAGVYGETASAGYSMDFDPTEGEDWHTALGSWDAFVTKLGPEGSYEWTRSFGGENGQDGNGVVADGAGNVYVAGNFQSTVDLDPGEGEDIRTAVPAWWCDCTTYDVFLTKLLPDGAYAWTATIGFDTHDIAYDLILDNNENPIMTGEYGYFVDFDPTEGEDVHSSYAATPDTFITQINADGSYGWTRTWGNIGEDSGDDLALGSNNDLYVSGTFALTVDFDPGEGVDEHTSAGYADFFISKFTCAPTDPVCEGDANSDGVVDPLDSGYVLSRLGCSVGAGDADCDAADVNTDNLVDPLDAGFVLSRLGDCE